MTNSMIVKKFLKLGTLLPNFIGILILLVISCSKDSEFQEEVMDSLEVFIDIEKLTYGVDEQISFTVSSNPNENLKTVCYSAFENIEACYSGLTDESIGTVHTINLGYRSPGIRKIAVELINNEGLIGTKEIEVRIIPQNSIKINKMKLVSFIDINYSWDPEYPENDENRLADLRFSLRKVGAGYGINETNYYIGDWILSDILENQGNLEWDLSNEEYFIGLDNRIFFSLADIDPGPLAQDILFGPPYELEFDFQEFQLEKPDQLRFQYPDLEIDFILEVEWL